MPIIKVQKTEVKLKRPLAEIPEAEFKRGLVASPTFTRLPIHIESLDILPVVKEQTPVDGVEVVEWMQGSAADFATLDAWAEEYARLRRSPQPRISFGAGDPWAPGVRSGDIFAPSVVGSTVIARGYAVVQTPRGNFNCPVGGKTTGIFKDILAWAALPWASSHQWRIGLAQFIELANTPITERVRFPAIERLVAPNFFIVGSMFPPPAMVMHLGFTSNQSQKVAITGRSRGDYTNVMFSDSLDIPAGETTMDYVLIGGLPIDAFVLHVQPSDGTQTILDSLSVTPP